jgi:biotin carboxyl carrier protein
MKITVRVDDQTFEVEVGDVRERPVIASVNGRRFEVWPVSTDGAADQRPATDGEADKRIQPTSQPTHSHRREPAASTLQASANSLKVVCAPIPGVIVSVAAQPGTEVKVGQELCVLEAMKMKNAIRATRAGRIAFVKVSAGQTVKHGDALMEYVD